ncbi:MAG: aspartate aminotransferase family protein, partial [Actinobacteria bacterium]|nr:aspartate aminotransferase family protein [Actinomycetota bacterium]
AAMTALADRFADGVRATIDQHALPWHVSTLGARAEYQFTPHAPRGGIEAAVAGDRDLDRYLRLHLINRGVLMTPFHCMALMSPATTAADVDRHTDVFAAAVAELL